MKKLERNFKQTMERKARKRGIYENFGQAEIRSLKEINRYNPYGTPEERDTARRIDALEQWCQNYTG